MRITLESGNWVDILPVQSLKAKHRDRSDGAVKLYVQFDDQGNPDLSGMPLSMSLATVRRDALMAQIISDWSFVIDPDEENSPKLPVPYWDAEKDEIAYVLSYGEIPLDDFNELVEVHLAPYLEKIQRKPDPKGTTTASSNGTSRGRASASRKG